MMMFRPLVVLPCFLISCALSAAAIAPDFAANLEPIAPIEAPFPMPQLARPVFPDRVVSVVEHGAVDEKAVADVTAAVAKNTAAFEEAIRACAEAGGGHVLVPAGRWHVGPVHLRSNIDLHLAGGAELVFSNRFADYLPVVLVRVGGIDMWNYSPLVYARDCENIAITGPGKLNGNAKAWWPWKSRETRAGFEMGAKGVPVEKRVFGTEEAAIRPSFVSFVNCKNVLLEGFTIGSGPNWTIHPVYCENIILRRVHVDTDGPNNDGVDPDSCRNLLIEHCDFETGDDCVVLKSGYNEDGWRVARPTENVVMRDCRSKRGHGGLVVGSEMSGGVRNVYMRDCEFDGTDRAVRIKSRIDRGGVVENVWAENVRARNLKYEVVILNMDYGSDRNAPPKANPPLFRNFHFKNFTADGAPAAVRITGLESKPDAIQAISFENMAIKADTGVSVRYAKDVSFANVRLTIAKGEKFNVRDSSGVTVDGKAVE